MTAAAPGEAAGARARPLVGAAARRALAWALVPVVAVLALCSPMLLTKRAFGPDWTNHLWFVWKQGIQIGAMLHPSYFVHAERIGIFYPDYAFYGGSMYAIAGGLSALIGQRPVVAYIGVSVAAVGMAYGGWLWMAHQSGLRGWRAQIPALVFTTSAYYLTNLYGRGAWGEFMATSAIPLVAASALALLRSRRWGILAPAALVVSTVVLSGSHNITLLWSVVFFAVVAAILALALPRHGREVSARGLAGVLLFGALGVGLNLWFLLPDVAYAKRSFSSTLGFGGVPFLDTPALVFDPIRRAPPESTTPGLFVQLPVLVLGWSLLALVLAWRSSLERFWKGLAVGLVVLLAVLLELVFKTGPWAHLPRLLRYIQFPYRLQTYVVMCVAGLALAALSPTIRERVTRSGRVLAVVLVAVVAIGSAQALAQAWSPRSNPASFPPDSWKGAFASQYALPPAWVDPGNYRDASAALVQVAPERVVTFAPNLVVKDHFDRSVRLPAGTAPIMTNISAGPYFVKVKGVQVLGRSQNGLMVVRRSSPGSGPVHVSISAAHPWPVKLGIAGTLASAVALLVLLVGGLWRRRRDAR